MNPKTLLASMATFCMILASCSKDKPDPAFSVNSTDMHVDAVITFKNESLNATSFSWEFGDGTNSTDIHPTHAYQESGVYSVNLTAINESGSESASKEITILAHEPVADFSVVADNLPAPATIQFQNLSEFATSYSWDFGDNGNSTEANPEHTFTTEGSYSVTLTATGPGGTNSITKTVTVITPANITAGENLGPYTLFESWSSINTKVSSSTYRQGSLAIGSVYYHLCVFEDDGVSFFFRSTSSTLKNTDNAIIISGFDPFEGVTEKGITLGSSTVANVIAAYGQASTESNETLYYNAIGISFEYDEDRSYIVEISIDEAISTKSARAPFEEILSTIKSKGTSLKSIN